MTTITGKAYAQALIDAANYTHDYLNTNGEIDAVTARAVFDSHFAHLLNRLERMAPIIGKFFVTDPTGHYFLTRDRHWTGDWREADIFATFGDALNVARARRYGVNNTEGVAFGPVFEKTLFPG